MIISDISLVYKSFAMLYNHTILHRMTILNQRKNRVHEGLRRKMLWNIKKYYMKMDNTEFQHEKT